MILNMISIGDLIKRERKFMGMTQFQLAEKIGISVVTLRKYEKNEVIPTINILQKIISALGMTAAEFQRALTGYEKGIDDDLDFAYYLADRLADEKENVKDDLKKNNIDLDNNTNLDRKLINSITENNVNIELEYKYINLIEACFKIFDYSTDISEKSREDSINEDDEPETTVETGLLSKYMYGDAEIYLAEKDIMEIGTQIQRYFRFLLSEKGIEIEFF